jgi:hypothetical protein
MGATGVSRRFHWAISPAMSFFAAAGPFSETDSRRMIVAFLLR